MLGAGLNGDKPSAVLEMRLERAHLYLQEHPQTIVIVSGGQGPTEPVSEAESMQNWLLGKGIPASPLHDPGILYHMRGRPAGKSGLNLFLFL